MTITNVAEVDHAADDFPRLAAAGGPKA